MKKYVELSHRKVTSEDVELFERPIGQIILNYALAEHAAEIWLMAIFPNAAKANVASKVPRELGRKFELIAKCLAQLPAFAVIREEALRLVSIFQQHSRLRNTLAHGAMSHFNPSPTPSMIFVRVSYSKQDGIHILQDEVVSLADLVTAIDETSDALVDMHKVAMHLHGIAKL